MAEALLRKHQGDKYDVHSAGMDPKEAVHPLAVKVMAEIGIDISRHRTKSSLEYLGRHPVRHVLIVCDKAHGTCPRIWPGAYTRTYMPFDDPAEAEGNDAQRLTVFRRVRDELDRAMAAWEPHAEAAR